LSAADKHVAVDDVGWHVQKHYAMSPLFIFGPNSYLDHYSAPKQIRSEY